jgi:hypothetical protein
MRCEQALGRFLVGVRLLAPLLAVLCPLSERRLAPYWSEVRLFF